MVHTNTHTAKPVYEQEDVTMLWNQAVHTYGDVTANRSDIIIKNKKKKKRKTCMWQYLQTEMLKGSGKEAKIRDFMYRGTKNVEP